MSIDTAALVNAALWALATALWALAAGVPGMGPGGD